MKLSYLISVLACLGFVSCAPMGGYSGMGGAGVSSQAGAGGGVAASSRSGVGSQSAASRTARPTASELQELRKIREAQVTSGGIGYSSGAGAGVNSGGGLSGGAGAGGEDLTLPPLPSMNTNYRYAMPVPGRKGWVYNPYTNTTVDARGVESGRLIYDETDPANRKEDGTLRPIAEMPHKFRVP